MLNEANPDRKKLATLKSVVNLIEREGSSYSYATKSSYLYEER